MGNNALFSTFEHVVVGAYKLGKLDKPLLKVLMEIGRDSDIDSGGKSGLFVKENGQSLEVEDIVIKVWTGKIIPAPKLPKDYNKWTEEQSNANEKWQESQYEAFSKITRKFGWF